MKKSEPRNRGIAEILFICNPAVPVPAVTLAGKSLREISKKPFIKLEDKV